MTDKQKKVHIDGDAKKSKSKRHHHKDRDGKDDGDSKDVKHTSKVATPSVTALGPKRVVELTDGTVNLGSDVASALDKYTLLGPSITVPKDFPGNQDLSATHKISVDLDIIVIGTAEQGATRAHFMVMVDDQPTDKGALIGVINGRFNISYSPSVHVPLGKQSKVGISWKSIDGLCSVNAGTSASTDSGTFWYQVKGITFKPL